jgi:hypothetical protein
MHTSTLKLFTEPHTKRRAACSSTLVAAAAEYTNGRVTLGDLQERHKRERV